MNDEEVLKQLFELFVRDEVPPTVRAAIAAHFGEVRYLLAKEAVIAFLSDSDSIVRDACVDAVANHWQLPEVGPKLIEMIESDPQDFVRMRAVQGLGAIRYDPSIPYLKRIVMEKLDDEALQQTAYEAILSILGKDDYNPLEIGIDTPLPIDWELVRNL